MDNHERVLVAAAGNIQPPGNYRRPPQKTGKIVRLGLAKGRSGLNLAAPSLALLRQRWSPVRLMCSQPRRRQVLQQGGVDRLSVIAQGRGGTLQIHRVPQHDGGRHQARLRPLPR